MSILHGFNVLPIMVKMNKKLKETKEKISKNTFYT